MGIYSISGLPSNLTYELTDYNLHDKLCDTSGNCTLGATKVFSVTIKYIDGGYDSSNTTYDIKLDFDFRNIYVVSYKNITNKNYISEIISGETVNILFIDDIPNRINVYINGIEVDRNEYVYLNNHFIFDNVTGNIVIEKAESILVGGQEFSAILKNFVNGTTDATYSSEDSKILYIGFYEDRIPSNYLEEEFFSLPSVSVSGDNKVFAYNDAGNVYIYSKNDIATNYSMYSMFRNMISLKEIDLLELDTSRNTSLQSTFAFNHNLEKLDLSNFNTSNVTNMMSTFTELFNSSLELDFSNFDTSRVVTMNGMFNYSNLKSINLESFYTESLVDMDSMFYQCYYLESLNVSNFITNKVETFDHTFSRTKLKTLDLSSFDTSSASNMAKMFGSNSDLTTIYVGDGWDVSSVTSSDGMFTEDISLVGGSGTVFDSNYIDATYARVDSAEKPGYLTYKSKD